MTLKNGSFYQDGVKVPIEFGNKEQIKLINAVKLLKEDGAVPALIFDEAERFICGISFTCVCGSKVQCNWETEEEGYEIEGEKVKCQGCDFTFVVCADENNFLFFKLK